MPIIIRCHSCGFILYQGDELRSIDLILRMWDYKCPVCMSPLSRTPLGIKVVSNANYKRIDDEEVKGLIIDLLRKNGQLTTTEIVDKVVETLGVDTSPLRDKVRDIIYGLERSGVIMRVSVTKGRKIIWALKA
jgi:hypothetical protein